MLDFLGGDYFFADGFLAQATSLLWAAENIATFGVGLAGESTSATRVQACSYAEPQLAGEALHR